MLKEPPARKAVHRKSDTLEELLAKVNGLLADSEARVLAGFRGPVHPVVLIVGAPRSGTTLLLQWLASTGKFAYPTNLLSRFYGAPYIGALIQEMLTKHDFRGEIFDLRPEIPFESRLGKTRGVLAPNEFWYFWRRFFHFGEIQKLTEEELRTVDVDTFLAEIAAVESVFAKPFAMKGMIAQWNLSFLDRSFPRVLFLHIRRRPLENARSLLDARRDYFGDERAWYSFKPPEYGDLTGLEPLEQVTAQVFWTNRAVEEGLAGVAPDRKLAVSYEDFCEDAAGVWKKLAEKLSSQGYDPGSYAGPRSFTPPLGNVVTEAEKRRVVQTWGDLSGEKLDV